MSRYQPEVYKSEGGFSAIGIPILFASLCLAATALGWLASFIGQFFYLIVLFPLVIGAGLVGVGILVGHFTKMRSIYIAASLGLISGILAIVSMHYFDYLRFLSDRQDLMAAAPALNNIPPNEMTPEQIEAVQVLKEVRLIKGFPGFMRFQAAQGVSIGKIGQGGLNLGFVGTWIYWVIELLVVTVMTTLGLVAGASSPFCAECETWKEERKLGTLKRKDENVKAMLKKGKIEELRDLNPAPEGGNLILTVAVCPNCKDDTSITVKVEEVKKDKKGEETKKELIHLVYPGEALAEFKQLFKKKKESKEEEEEEGA